MTSNIIFTEKVVTSTSYSNPKIHIKFNYTPINEEFYYIFVFKYDYNNEKYIFVSNSQPKRKNLLDKLKDHKEEFFVLIANKIAELCIRYSAKYDYYHNHIPPFDATDTKYIHTLVNNILHKTSQ